MSGLFDWRVANDLTLQDPPVDALLMAAWIHGDGPTRFAIEHGFPALAREARARQQAPGGILPQDPP